MRETALRAVVSMVCAAATAGIVLGGAGTAGALLVARVAGPLPHTDPVDMGLVSLDADALVEDPLAPGYVARVSVRVRNTSGRTVLLTTMHQTPGRRARLVGRADCDPGVVSLVRITTFRALLPGNGRATLTGAVRMAPDAPNGCQGAAFVVPVTVSGRVE